MFVCFRLFQRQISWQVDCLSHWWWDGPVLWLLHCNSLQSALVPSKSSGISQLLLTAPTWSKPRSVLNFTVCYSDYLFKVIA